MRESMDISQLGAHMTFSYRRLRHSVVPVVLFCILFGCQRKVPLVGQWRDISDTPSSGVSEFFQDGTCSIQRDIDRFGGHWTQLADGRFKIDYTAIGTTLVSFGNLKGDELSLDEGNRRSTWVRIGSERDKSEETFQKGQKLFSSGDFKGAIPLLKEGADHGYPGPQNSLAWLYATAKLPEARDGEKAVEYAEKAVSTAKTYHPYLDTLAAALARNGSFSKAKQIEGHALSALENDKNLPDNVKSEKRKRYQARLILYSQGQAYTEN
jgi:tetratricopeptide (TPR) repeat protein